MTRSLMRSGLVSTISTRNCISNVAHSCCGETPNDVTAAEAAFMRAIEVVPRRNSCWCR